MEKRENRQKRQSVYLPPEYRKEMLAEGARLDRPLSWIVKLAWKMARERIKALPTMPKETE